MFNFVYRLDFNNLNRTNTILILYHSSLFVTTFVSLDKAIYLFLTLCPANFHFNFSTPSLTSLTNILFLFFSVSFTCYPCNVTMLSFVYVHVRIRKSKQGVHIDFANFVLRYSWSKQSNCSLTILTTHNICESL